MSIQKREVEYAKELDDCAALLVHIVRDVKAGKTAAEIASGSLQDLMTAMSGIDQVDDELAANRKVALQTIGYRTGELTDAFLAAPKSGGAGGDPV